jgi:hypothetical protein
LSLSAVVLRSTMHALPYLCQIGDVLDAGKVKLILPLRKGNALGLAEREFITTEEAAAAFARLVAYYRERGIHVAAVPEPARNSPFIEDIVVHGNGRFDIECEVDLLAAQLSAQLRAARQPAADRVVRSICATVGQNITDIPPSMTTAGRVQWIAARLTKLGLSTGT